MPEVKKDYVSLADLESPKFRFVASLPNFVDPRSIGININRISLLCRLGGIRHLRVEGLTDEETSSFVPTLVGFDTQGNAYAAKTGMKTSVPTYTTDSQSYDLGPLPTRGVNGVIKINVDETANRILSETRWSNGVNNNDAWSYHLNSIIKNGIVDIGTKHLILGADKRDYLLELLPVSSMTINSSSVDGLNLLVLFGIWYFMVNVFSPHVTRRPEGWRHSLLLYGPQLDRALLLKLASLKSTLVKSIPNSEMKS